MKRRTTNPSTLRVLPLTALVTVRGGLTSGTKFVGDDLGDAFVGNDLGDPFVGNDLGDPYKKPAGR